MSPARAAFERVAFFPCLSFAYDGLPVRELAEVSGLTLQQTRGNERIWSRSADEAEVLVTEHLVQPPACTVTVFGTDPEEIRESVESVLVEGGMPAFMTFDHVETLEGPDQQISRVYQQRGEPYLNAVFTARLPSDGPQAPAALLSFHWSEKGMELLEAGDQ